MLADSEFNFHMNTSEPGTFTSMVNKDTETNGNTVRWTGDPNEYWMKVEFDNDKFKCLVFQADESESKPFVELDHDENW